MRKHHLYSFAEIQTLKETLLDWSGSDLMALKDYSYTTVRTLLNWDGLWWKGSLQSTMQEQIFLYTICWNMLSD